MRALQKALRIADYLLTFALAVVVVLLAYRKYWESYDSFLLIFSLVLGGVVSSAACCAFHELGHVLFGKICGFRFNSMRVGFVRIYRRDGKLRIAFGRLPDSLAGATEMLPADTDSLYGRFLAVVAGGPVFSLLFLAGCTVALALHESLPFAAFVFACTAVPCAFHIFFYNVLPFNDDNMDTDGGMLRGLIKKEPSYMTAVNILTIEGYLFQGRTPGEIDGDLYFGLPQLPEDDMNFILLTSYRFSYYLDRGDFASAAKAGDRLESVLCYVPAVYKGEIGEEILFNKCAVQRDAEGAKRFYPSVAQFLKGENTLPSHRVAAAYELYVNGDFKAALQEVSAAQQCAENCPVPGEEKYERRLLARIRADMDAARSAGHTE